VERVLGDAVVRTPDLGGRHHTGDVVDAVVKALEAP
jgi:isocitrate/isopropylmalate dehydrogenase